MKTNRPSISASSLNLKDQLISVNRVTKVVKGGKNLSFAALVVVGDESGHVGFGTGKAKEVPNAIKKAVEAAKKKYAAYSAAIGDLARRRCADPAHHRRHEIARRQRHRRDLLRGHMDVAARPEPRTASCLPRQPFLRPFARRPGDGPIDISGLGGTRSAGDLYCLAWAVEADACFRQAGPVLNRRLQTRGAATPLRSGLIEKPTGEAMA